MNCWDHLTISAEAFNRCTASIKREDERELMHIMSGCKHTRTITATLGDREWGGECLLLSTSIMHLSLRFLMWTSVFTEMRADRRHQRWFVCKQLVWTPRCRCSHTDASFRLCDHARAHLVTCEAGGTFRFQEELTSLCACGLICITVLPHPSLLAG